MVLGFAANGCGRRVGVTMLLVISGALLLPGCGGEPARPKPVPVKGSVTFRGKPLANARVTFFAKGAPMPAVGDTNDAGEFELSTYGKGDGAIVGENKVTVVSLSSGSGGMMPDPTKVASGEGALPGKAEIKGSDGGGGVTIPKLYGDSSNTPLTWTVKPEGETSVKLELK